MLQVVPLGTFVDNIDVDVVTGNVLVTGYPDAVMMLDYMLPPHTAIAPSKVQCTRSSKTTTGKLILFSR